MLNQLKVVNLQTPSAEELIYLLSQCEAMRAQYGKLNVEVPEWIDNRVRELMREINSRHQDIHDKRLMEINNRLDALKTPTEKRAELEKERERLLASTKA